jgi:hypothetical protein
MYLFIAIPDFYFIFVVVEFPVVYLFILFLLLNFWIFISQASTCWLKGFSLCVRDTIVNFEGDLLG